MNQTTQSARRQNRRGGRRNRGQKLQTTTGQAPAQPAPRPTDEASIPFRYVSDGVLDKTDTAYFEQLIYRYLIATVPAFDCVTHWPTMVQSLSLFNFHHVGSRQSQDLKPIPGIEPRSDTEARERIVEFGRAFEQIHQVYGSFLCYVRTFDHEKPGELLADLAKRFALRDDDMLKMFLIGVGERRYANLGGGARRVPTAAAQKEGGRPRRRGGSSTRSQRKNSRTRSPRPGSGNVKEKATPGATDDAKQPAGRSEDTKGDARTTDQKPQRRRRRGLFGGKKKEPRKS